MKIAPIYALLIAAALGHASPAHADLGTRAVKETMEFVMKKFGKEVAEEGAERLTARIVNATARHGDDLLHAVRKVGPKAVNLADDAGANAPSVLRLLNRYGDDAVRALGHPRALTLFGRYGDDAAEAMIKHKGIAEPLLDNLGKPAVKAFNALGPQGGRRLAMMGDDLAAIGRTPELLEVIARYGDRGMDFVWKNKGKLVSGIAVAAFLHDPESFISGVADLGKLAADNVIKPAAEAVTPVLNSAGHAMRPAITVAAKAARDLAVWIGRWLLIAVLSLILVIWLLSRGFFGKLFLKTGFKLAGQGIAGAIKQK